MLAVHGKQAEFGFLDTGEHHVEDGFTWYYKNVMLLPAQLIESAFVCIVISNSFVSACFTGYGIDCLHSCVGAFRFGIEFFKGDSQRPYWKGLSERNGLHCY